MQARRFTLIQGNIIDQNSPFTGLVCQALFFIHLLGTCRAAWGPWATFSA
jgi:hypothetical protein